MKSVFGEQSTRIEFDEVSLDLEHTIIEPNFMKPNSVLHESVLTGKRTWSRNSRFVEFTFTEYLFMYEDDGVSVLNQLLDMEDQEVTFYLHSDGGLTQKMWFVSIEIFPLIKPYSEDLAVCRLMNSEHLQFSKRIKAIPTGKKIKSEAGKYIRTKGIIL